MSKTTQASPLVSWPLVHYVLKGARHDKLVLAMIVMVGLTITLAMFMGSAAVIDKQISSFVYMAGSLRILGVFGLTLFLVFFFRRAMDNKDVDFLMSRPIGRTAFLFSHAIGFGVLATTIWALIFGAISLLNFGNWHQGFWLWGLSFWAEMIIMMMMGFFFALILRSASVASFACMAFYVLCRLQGQLLGIIKFKADLDQTNGLLSGIMKSITMFLPRLDLMGQTSWLLYGPTGNFSYQLIILQTIVFIVLVFAAMTTDFVRKQF